MKVNPFARQGHYTIFDNVILDEIMPRLSPNAWKVLCFVIRKTKGFHKDEEALSYAAIMKGTGIKSKSTLSAALKELLPDEQTGFVGLLLGTAHGENGRYATPSYRLNPGFEVEVGSTETVPGPSTETVPVNGTETVPVTSTETVHIKTKGETKKTKESAREEKTTGELRYLDENTQRIVEALLSVRGWDKSEALTLELVSDVTRTYPGVDALATATSLAFKIRTGAVGPYKKPSRTFSNWVASDAERRAFGADSGDPPRRRKKIL
jgi:hypothetical protein